MKVGVMIPRAEVTGAVSFTLAPGGRGEGEGFFIRCRGVWRYALPEIVGAGLMPARGINNASGWINKGM